jgi:hypothetical protein
MKTKQSASNKKQAVTVKDLKSKKNPKGGAQIASMSNHKPPPGITDREQGGVLTSY